MADVLIGNVRVELARNLPALRHCLQLVDGTHIFKKSIAFCEIAQRQNRLKYIVELRAFQPGFIGIHTECAFRIKDRGDAFDIHHSKRFHTGKQEKRTYPKGMPKAENRTGIYCAAARFLASCAFLRAAAFLWIMPFAAA